MRHEHGRERSKKSSTEMGNRDIWDEIELVGTGEHLDEEMFEFLSAYADGECSAKERRLVEAYLAENAGAREQLAELRMQSALASEQLLDPPEWLRASILASTVDRRRLRWPFAAGISAAAAAAALAIYVSVPLSESPERDDLLATNVVDEGGLDEPILSRPLVDTPATQKVPDAKPSERMTATPPRTERTAARAVRTAIPVADSQPTSTGGGSSVAMPAVSEEQPDPEVTYAVAEYHGASFEAKQPDVFDAEPTSPEPSKSQPTTSPALLPDAREKLRDKVKKMNEEKLEIEGSET